MVVKILLMKIFKQLLSIKIRLVNSILNDLRMVLQNMWVRNMLLQFQMEHRITLCTMALGVDSGDKVITTPITFGSIGKLCSLLWGRSCFFRTLTQILTYWTFSKEIIRRFA
jgi:hypothetical protein